MSAFDDALGIGTEKTPEGTEEAKPPTEPETKPDEGDPPTRLKMHEHKDEFKEYAAEQKRVSGGS